MTSSTKALRKFGITVGLGFAILGTISWARDHTIAPRVLWTMAALLVVPALVAPALLGPVERVWMRFALVLGHINTRVILSALFYLLLTPIGFVLRLFRDPLDRSVTDERRSFWIRREPEQVDRARYEQQF